MIVYKVVNLTKNKNIFTSAVVDDSDLIVYYKLNEISVPNSKTCGLFVFKDFEKAMKFKVFNQQILKCKAKNVREFKIRGNYYSETLMLQFWETFIKLKKSRKNTQDNSFYGDLVSSSPSGTYICSELTPLEVVC